MNPLARFLAMMLLALFLVVFGVHVMAKPVGVADTETGAALVFHDDKGICVGEALRAEFVAPGKPTIAGCWVARGPFVYVVFLDGDIARVPVAAIRKPTPA